MGHPKPDAETAYLEARVGSRWTRLLSNGQVFNWFADFAAHESKIDREKIVKRLRVFSSRDENPTAFWVILMTKFYDEGAHVGLRKFVEGGVTYFCPPQYFLDFKASCEATSAHSNTVQWVFRPEGDGGRVYGHVLSTGNKSWFKKSWPDALKLRGKRCLIWYYPFGVVDPLSDEYEDGFDEASLGNYQSCHSLLCLMYATRSPGAFDISLDEFAAQHLREIVADPYLGISSPEFGDAARLLAGLAVADCEISPDSQVLQKTKELLSSLRESYAHLKFTMDSDSDYAHPMTFSLMPLHKKSAYGDLMADFENAMKPIILEYADEIAKIAESLEGVENERTLHIEYDESEDRQHYSIEVVRQYLASTLIPEYMALEGFDSILEASRKIVGNPEDVKRMFSLKEVVRQSAKRLTDVVEGTGEFPVTAPLLIALMEVGCVRPDESSFDYRDLIFRIDQDRPWLCAPAKFSGETDSLERVRSEFLAYCRIATGGCQS